MLWNAWAPYQAERNVSGTASTAPSKSRKRTRQYRYTWFAFASYSCRKASRSPAAILTLRHGPGDSPPCGHLLYVASSGVQFRRLDQQRT